MVDETLAGRVFMAVILLDDYCFFVIAFYNESHVTIWEIGIPPFPKHN